MIRTSVGGCVLAHKPPCKGAGACSSQFIACRGGCVGDAERPHAAQASTRRKHQWPPRAPAPAHMGWMLAAAAGESAAMRLTAACILSMLRDAMMTCCQKA